MSTYQEVKAYFKNIAEKNKKIQHSDSSSIQKFYEFSLEEVVFARMHALPSYDDGAFLIFTGFVDRFQFLDKNLKTREIIFFVQQSSGEKNYQERETAKQNCLTIVEEIISKMIKDSEDGEEIFEYSFNRADSVNVIPNDIKIGTGMLTGWQVSVSLKNEFVKCYDSDEWIQNEEI